LRWNHKVEPGDTIPGRSVDRAFIDFKEISEVVGFDVEKKVKELLEDKRDKINKKK